MESPLDQAPCLYFSATDDGILQEVNEKLCTSLGYTKSELIGKKTDLLFTIATRIFQQTHFFPLLKMQGHAEEIYITLQQKNGEQLPVLINAERKTIDGRNLTLHIGIIVHNRKKFEDELIAAKKAAETALAENTALVQAKQELQRNAEELDRQMHLVTQQNEELRQFNRVVTHDIQEPLRKLFLFSDLLLENNEKQEQKKLAEKIKRVSEQMRSVIAGLQQYVWLTETPPKPTIIEPGQLLSEVVPEVEKDYPGVHLSLTTSGLQSFYGDYAQMRLLFYHLLANAVRFRKDHRQAFVSVTASTLQLNKFRNVADKYQYIEFLRIQVCDKGMGFDAVYKDQVFELFRRLHSESGRGIGLSLCKKIMDNHKGTISIDSKAGEGTTVTLLLPADKPEEHP